MHFFILARGGSKTESNLASIIFLVYDAVFILQLDILMLYLVDPGILK